MLRIVGIAYMEGPAGTRAVIAGMGLDVWEVISAYKHCGGCLGTLRMEFPWLSDLQLRSALAYYHLRRGEIDARLDREQFWTLERVRKAFPFLTPSPPSGMNPDCPGTA